VLSHSTATVSRGVTFATIKTDSVQTQAKKMANRAAQMSLQNVFTLAEGKLVDGFRSANRKRPKTDGNGDDDDDDDFDDRDDEDHDHHADDASAEADSDGREEQNAHQQQQRPITFVPGRKQPRRLRASVKHAASTHDASDNNED
jgi:hypothetical protein